MNTDYPSLTPLTSQWMHAVLDDHSSLQILFEQYGSPINLHHTGPFVDNYLDYKEILDNHLLPHTIFFARKANTCRVFAKEAARQGFGVDTASYRELEQCLELGCPPDKLVLTAAIKEEKLIRLALENSVLMILDNEDECRLVNRMAEEMDVEPEVGMRIGGFKFEGEKLYSRFGFDMETAAAFIAEHIGPGNRYGNLRFKGLQFHLDGYSMDQRGEALIQCIQLADELKKADIATSFIDIGGGLLTNYLSDWDEWKQFWEELKKAVRGERDPITFENNGLGYHMVNGDLHGPPNVYPYFNNTPKARFLDAILSYQNEQEASAAALLCDRGIEFRMEPGRSLLDQAGMTLARVVHRKQDQRGDWLIGLQMNRSQLYSSSDDFLLDPIFVPMASSDKESDPVSVYFTGAYCLEQDIILKRKITLPNLAEPGDVIAFPNTAGYMMHFYETRSHLHPFTTNLVTHSRSSGGFIPDKSINRKG